MRTTIEMENGVFYDTIKIYELVKNITKPLEFTGFKFLTKEVNLFLNGGIFS